MKGRIRRNNDGKRLAYADGGCCGSVGEVVVREAEVMVVVVVVAAVVISSSSSSSSSSGGSSSSRRRSRSRSSFIMNTVLNFVRSS